MTTAETTRRPGRIRRRLNHLPAGLLGCAIVLVFAVPIAAIMRGAPGALGAAIGVLGVAVSYVLSGLAVAWADSISTQLTMPVGMATYVIKFSWLALPLLVFGDSTWPGLHPMAFGIIAAVLGWNAGHLWWLAHARIPYVEIDPS
jgi:hypothetical protein